MPQHAREQTTNSHRRLLPCIPLRSQKPADQKIFLYVVLSLPCADRLSARRGTPCRLFRDFARPRRDYSIDQQTRLYTSTAPLRTCSARLRISVSRLAWLVYPETRPRGGGVAQLFGEDPDNRRETRACAAAERTGRRKKSLVTLYRNRTCARCMDPLSLTSDSDTAAAPLDLQRQERTLHFTTF